jgi:hypothetical protein
VGEVVLHALVVVLRVVGQFLVQAIGELVLEFFAYRTGRLVIWTITFGRVRAQGLSEPGPTPPAGKWRDANGTLVLSWERAQLIGILFWISVLLAALAYEVFVRNPS